jgi:endo-1,4-beta-mannosidase
MKVLFSVALLVLTGSFVYSSSPIVQAAPAQFVTSCGTSLCINGQKWTMHASTIYKNTDNVDTIFQLAKTAKLNSIRAVNFWNNNFEASADPYNEPQWVRLDRILDKAKSNNLRVILDLSDYRNWFLLNNKNPYNQDWGPFIQFVANRKNSINGINYKDDPTIAFVSFAGEAEQPVNSTHGVTTAQLTDFYKTVFSLWKSHDPNHLVSSGGLSYLDWNSGIDWQTIFSLPQNDICSIHVYSTGDQSNTIPKVSSFCANLNKPWITEEFGFKQSLGDSTRANNLRTVYNLQKQYTSAGSGLWNLGLEVNGVNYNSDSYDVNTQTPLSLAIVQDYAPTVTVTNSPTVTNKPTVTPTGSITTTPTAIKVIPGDIGGGPNNTPDGTVNILDYAVLLDNYGKSPPTNQRADLDGDGKVTIMDYVILFEHYGM